MKFFVLILSVCLSVSNLVQAVQVVPTGAAKYQIKWVTLAESLRAEGAVWEKLRENLRLLGHAPTKIESDLIHPLQVNFPHILQSTAQALGMKQWNPSRGLKKSDYLTLANNLSLYQQILGSLGFWTQIPNFDVDTFLELALERHPGQIGGMVESMVGWSHLWIDSPHALRWATRLIDDSRQLTYFPWFLSHLDEASGEILGEHVKEMLQNTIEQNADATVADEGAVLMTLAAYVPEKYQPTSFKRALARYGWNANSPRAAYPALVTDDVGLMYHGSHYAGSCPHMSRGHLFTLGINRRPSDSQAWKNTVLISVNGEIVGALKREGDPSMVALRNVRNSDGKQVLSIGGVYLLPYELVVTLPHQEAGSRSWIGVDLPSLKVKPHQFLLNQNAWPNLDTKYWTKLLGLTEKQIGALDETRFERRATRAVIENLDCVQRFLQANAG